MNLKRSPTPAEGRIDRQRTEAQQHRRPDGYRPPQAPPGTHRRPTLPPYDQNRPAWPRNRRARPPRRAILATVVVAALTSFATPALAAPEPARLGTTVLPGTPPGLTASIEGYQPYVGQKTCDPAAKPGVVAFRDLLLKTYPASGSLGIVRDCGIGGQSEHKEGRAFDWANDASDPIDAANVDAVLTWLTKTDQYGNAHAMARRTGIMYMVWNRRIWKAYQANLGWQPYTGPSPHTGHVHISFGWAGARNATSYWRPGSVAPIDYGPGGTPTPPAPTVTTSADRTNIAIRRAFGSMTLTPGRPQDANAVKTMQRKVVAAPVDGIFGQGTAAAVRRAQAGLRLPVTGVFSPALERVAVAEGKIAVVGWALDPDSTAKVDNSVLIDGVRAAVVRTGRARTDLTALVPSYGADRGFAQTISVPAGRHTVCIKTYNLARTPGRHVVIGCRTVTVR